MEKKVKVLSKELAEASGISHADAQKVLAQTLSVIPDEALLNAMGAVDRTYGDGGFLVA